MDLNFGSFIRTKWLSLDYNPKPMSRPLNSGYPYKWQNDENIYVGIFLMALLIIFHTWRVYRSRKQTEGEGISNLLSSSITLSQAPSYSEHRFNPIKALCPSTETSMQLTVQERGSCDLAITVPLRVKVVRVWRDLFQAIMIPSDEMQIPWATTPISLLIKRPLLNEWSRISDELEHDTTIPRSELTQQQIISPRWPRRTCMGPSICLLLLLSAKPFAMVLLLVEVGVPEPAEVSDVLLKWELDDALCILQIKTVASLDPVTR